MPARRQRVLRQHDEQREETRQSILAAARDLMIEQGYSRTTMEMIAARAGISRSSLYRHFDTKWQVAKLLISTLPPYLEQKWRECPVGEQASIDRITIWLRDMLALLAKDRQYVLLVREIDAIEPEAARQSIEVNDKIIAILAGSSPSFAAAREGRARSVKHLFLLQVMQFFYMSLRGGWGPDEEPPYEEMASYMKTFLAPAA